MEINSFNFFYILIPLLILYYNTHKVTVQNILLFIASIIAICIIDFRLAWIALTLTIISFLLSKYWISYDNKQTYRLIGLSIGIILVLTSLIYFKYYNFFIESISALLNVQTFSTINIIAPIGISYYTFRIISYLIDTYRGDIKAEKNLIRYSVYTIFFPTLLSGPIDKSSRFIPQLYTIRKFKYNLFIIGLRQILWGMVKKMVLADNLSIIVNGVWSNIESTSTINLIFVIFLFPIQLYFDFSGYSDMALGVAKLLNIKCDENFRYPFFSRNIAEFWRRWHKSLNNWFVYYLYIPLGGNRRGLAHTIANTLIIFTLCGFWHGANLHFIVWGAYFSLLFIPLILTGKNKLYKNDYVAYNKIFPSAKETMQMLCTYFLFSIGLILFRTPNIETVIIYISSIYDNRNIIRPFIWNNYCNLAILFIIIEWFGRKYEFPIYKLNYKYSEYLNILIYTILIELILRYGNLISSEFIYGKF